MNFIHVPVAPLNLEVLDEQLDDREEFTRPPKDYIIKYGLNEAIILEEMAFRQQVTNKPQALKKKIGKVMFYTPVKSRAGKKTFFTPIKSIQPAKYKMPTLDQCFPWLTQPGISKILNKLKHEKLIEISSTARSKMVHTKSYFVPLPVVQKVKAGSRCKLSKKDCVAHGPAGALVLNYVQYNLQRQGGEWINLSPDKLKHLIPLSENTIRRGEKKLVIAGELIKDGFTTWYKLGKANPLAGKVCGMVPRKVTYYNDFEATGFSIWKAREQKLAYTEADIPELQQLAKEVAAAFISETGKELSDIKPDEYRFFYEAAYVCWKHDFDPAGYVAAQFNDEPFTTASWPKPWMPELLIRDDAEQRCVDSEFSEGSVGISN
jgi:hypothetical protein